MCQKGTLFYQASNKNPSRSAAAYVICANNIPTCFNKDCANHKTNRYRLQINSKL